ncbi:MAG: cytochrome c biogenesis CcdA family protein [Acidimicrobiales bacterium]
MSGAEVGYLAAFGGGLVSFLSPCVLPIVPAYLSVIGGVDASAAGGAGQRWRIVGHTGLFVAGFSAVFITLGLSATAVGSTLTAHHVLLTRVSGLVIVAMALFLAGSLVLRAPWLYREVRLHPAPSRLGVVAAPVAGAAFGFGWTPCIGPVLGSILALAATRSHTWEGAGLLAAYSAGLGVPFLAAGLAMGRLAGVFGFAASRPPSSDSNSRSKSMARSKCPHRTARSTRSPPPQPAPSCRGRRGDRTASIRLEGQAADAD